MKKTRSLLLFSPDLTSEQEIPLFICRIWAGFPSPADNYLVESINLNKMLIGKKKSNIKLIVADTSHLNLGSISHNDLVIIDTSILHPTSGSTILCTLNGEPMIKILTYKKNEYVWLGTEENLNQFQITEESDFIIYGIVTYSITDHSTKKKHWEFNNNESIDIHSTLVSQPPSTFFAIIDGDSMKEAGIFEDDLVVIDKVFQYQDDQIVLCCVDSDFTIKYMKVDKEEPDIVWLMPANNKFAPIKLTTDDYLKIWGQIKYSITPHNGRRFA